MHPSGSLMDAPKLRAQDAASKMGGRGALSWRNRSQVKLQLPENWEKIRLELHS